MTKMLQAISEIHRTIKPGVNANKETGEGRKPPVVQVIPPTGLFEARNQEEYDELTAGDRPAAHPYKTNSKSTLSETDAAKAVRAVSGNAVVVPETGEPTLHEDPILTNGEGDETVVGGGVNVDDLPTEDELNAMTRKADLVEQGRIEGVELEEDGNTKADLVKAILDHRSGDELL